MRVEGEHFQFFVLFDALVELVSGEATSLGAGKGLADVDDRSSGLRRDEILDLSVDKIRRSGASASENYIQLLDRE